MKVTISAFEKLSELKTNDYLRISVKGGGCSGLLYNMEWITEKNTDDICLALGTFIVIIDPKSREYLKDVELDYSEDMNNMGFIWNNPNAKRKCGCGSSFNA